MCSSDQVDSLAFFAPILWFFSSFQKIILFMEALNPNKSSPVFRIFWITTASQNGIKCRNSRKLHSNQSQKWIAIAFFPLLVKFSNFYNEFLLIRRVTQHPWRGEKFTKAASSVSVHSSSSCSGASARQTLCKYFRSIFLFEIFYPAKSPKRNPGNGWGWGNKLPIHF